MELLSWPSPHQRALARSPPALSLQYCHFCRRAKGCGQKEGKEVVGSHVKNCGLLEC